MVSFLHQNVVSRELAEEFTQSLNALPRNFFDWKAGNRCFGLHKEQASSNCWFPVTFNKKGKLHDESVTNPFLYLPNHGTIAKTAKVALEWMAMQEDWKGQSREMAISILQHYQIKEGQSTCPIEWVRDSGNLSLVILLDDEKKWEGGDILLKRRFKKERAPMRLGDGAFFSSSKVKPSFLSLTAKSHGISCTILTLQAKEM